MFESSTALPNGNLPLASRVISYAIFALGQDKQHTDEDTGTVLKISDLDGAKRQKLNQAPVHNLNEERSVGFINYELEIRGKKHLESASKKINGVE